MKNLLGILCLTVSTVYGQTDSTSVDSVMFMPKRVGLWYLERHYTATFLEKEVATMDSLLTVWKDIVDEKNLQLQSYGTDSIVWMKLRKAADDKVDVYKKGEEFYKDKAKAFRRQRNWVIAIAVALITLLSI